MTGPEQDQLTNVHERQVAARQFNQKLVEALGSEKASDHRRWLSALPRAVEEIVDHYRRGEQCRAELASLVGGERPSNETIHALNNEVAELFWSGTQTDPRLAVLKPYAVTLHTAQYALREVAKAADVIAYREDDVRTFIEGAEGKRIRAELGLETDDPTEVVATTVAIESGVELTSARLSLARGLSL